MNLTGDQTLLKNINRMALVRLVRSNPGVSRASLAQTTGLTKSTISQLVQELIDEGWLAEDDVITTGTAGRRPTPLRLDTQRLALIGADLTSGRLYVAATNLTGEIIEHFTRGFEGNDVKTIVALVARTIAEVARRMHAQNRTVLGAGLAVPGPVHVATGVLRSSPNFGWNEVPLGAEVSAGLAREGFADLPVFLQRRAATAALGEVEFSPAQVEEPLLYIHLGMGVGAGLFVSDRLLSGHGGFAGDVGHQQLIPDGPRCSCGRHGCAEALISWRAMAETLGVTPTEFEARLHYHDEAAVKVLHQAGHYVGVLMHNLWSTFDPAQIVVGGPCCRFGTEYLDSARHTLEALANEAGLTPPKVSAARFAENAVAIGATALVLHQLMRPSRSA